MEERKVLIEFTLIELVVLLRALESGIPNINDNDRVVRLHEKIEAEWSRFDERERNRM